MIIKLKKCIKKITKERLKFLTEDPPSPIYGVGGGRAPFMGEGHLWGRESAPYSKGRAKKNYIIKKELDGGGDY